MQPTIDSVRRQAVTAESVRRRTDDSERRILDAAEQRLGAVGKRLGELRPTAMSRRKHGDEYMALTTERGQLLQVIENAKARLGPGAAGRDSTVGPSDGNL